MSGKDSRKWAICEVVITLLMQERSLELARQLLGQTEDFEPYTAFCRISKNKSVITCDDLWQYVLDNGKNASWKSCRTLVAWYDTDKDQAISYKEFLDLILPKDNADIRAILAQKDCSSIHENDRLSARAETFLASLINKEMGNLARLEQDLKVLGNESWSIVDVLFEIVETSRIRSSSHSEVNINFNNLKSFTIRAGLDLNENELINFIKRLDRDDDGVVNRLDLEFCLAALISEEVPATQATKKVNRYEGLISNDDAREYNGSSKKALRAYERSRVRNSTNLDKSREKLGLEPNKLADMEVTLELDRPKDIFVGQRSEDVADKSMSRVLSKPVTKKYYYREEIFEREPEVVKEAPANSGEDAFQGYKARMVRKDNQDPVEPSEKRLSARRQSFRQEIEQPALTSRIERAQRTPSRISDGRSRLAAPDNRLEIFKDDTPQKLNSKRSTPRINPDKTVKSRSHMPEEAQEDWRAPHMDKLSAKLSNRSFRDSKKDEQPALEVPAQELFFSFISKVLEKEKGVEAARANLASLDGFSAQAVFETVAGPRKQWVSQKDLLLYLQSIGVKSASIESIGQLYDLQGFPDSSLLTAEEFCKLINSSQVDGQKTVGKYQAKAKNGRKVEAATEEEIEVILADLFSRLISLARLTEDTRAKCRKGLIDLTKVEDELSNGGSQPIKLQMVNEY